MASTLTPRFTSISLTDDVISPISPAYAVINGSSNALWIGAVFRSKTSPDDTFNFPATQNLFGQPVESYPGVYRMPSSGTYELSYVMAHNESNGFNYDRVYYGGTYYESVAGRAVMTKEQDGELTYESTHNFNFKNYTVEVYADIPTPVLIYLDFTVDNGVLSIDYVADFTTTVGNIVFAIEPVSARGEFTDALILESDSSVGTVSEELPESFKDGKYVATVFVSSIGFLKEGAVTTTYNAEDNEAWVAKQVAGKTQTLYFDEYTFLPTNFTFSYDAPAVITSESSQIVLIVDQGILSDGAVLLRDIVETKRFEDGILAEHKLVYAGSEFSYDAIDPLIQVVTRDDEFTSEFFSEITALNVVASDFSYSDLVKLVGVSAVDEVLLHIAGSDGYFVA